jgi:hypothetical protein
MLMGGPFHGFTTSTFGMTPFISIEGNDRTGRNVATWLRRRLQDYRLSRSLSRSESLRVYLDTAFEACQ